MTVIYFDTSNEGFDIDFRFGILESSDADLLDVETLQFWVDRNSFLMETVVSIEP